MTGKLTTYNPNEKQLTYTISGKLLRNKALNLKVQLDT